MGKASGSLLPSSITPWLKLFLCSWHGAQICRGLGLLQLGPAMEKRRVLRPKCTELKSGQLLEDFVSSLHEQWSYPVHHVGVLKILCCKANPTSKLETGSYS